MQCVRTYVLSENYAYIWDAECAGLEDCLRRRADQLPVGYSLRRNEVWVDPKVDPWVFGYPYRHGSQEFDTPLDFAHTCRYISQQCLRHNRRNGATL